MIEVYYVYLPVSGSLIWGGEQSIEFFFFSFCVMFINVGELVESV